ncbi:putative ferric-chelate reductase 1 homolog [Amphibalanus amphitrite]|uniref:putative ferric-chelate reductase 1 homolog n=1 Tax=Amphibalanus amphitrite TaxID=1232801 RepID=UPI001C91E4F0|nr:putative ferric-chelate reductase 1 homolog [Amphibalanus amphitrite]
MVSGSGRALCLLVAVTALAVPGRALPEGAPGDGAVCSSLRPRHGSHKPQPGPAPFRLAARAAEPAGQWRVTLSGEQPFRGVLLQARAAAGDDPTPLGRFTASSDTHLIDCSGQPQSALTHSTPTSRDSLEVTWSAANSSGPVRFVATVVADYRTWWENVHSEPITVVTATRNTLRAAPLQESVASSAEEVYAGCSAAEYGCFGAPAGCEATKQCDVLFTYVTDGAEFKMRLMAAGQDDTYAAVGFSTDNKMSSDGVIVCAANGADNPPKVYYARNVDTGRDCEITSEANPESASAVQTWEKDGYFMCSFTQEADLVISDQMTIDLMAEHFLLVATGPIDASLKLRYHHSKREASAAAVNLTDASSPGAAGVPALIKAHGAFMLIAWIGTSGIGIISAQFFRGVWVGKKVLGTDVWFTIHRALMVMTALCTWIGFALISAQLGGLDFDHSHNIVGFVVFLLTIVQVFGAALRPHPDHRLRPLFAWGHRIGGVSAYLLAVTALLLAQKLAKIMLPDYWFWVVVAAVIVHLVISVLLLITDRCSSPDLSGSPQVAPDTGALVKTEAPGSPLRRAMLGFYVFSSAGFVIALVTILIVSTA